MVHTCHDQSFLEETVQHHNFSLKSFTNIVTCTALMVLIMILKCTLTWWNQLKMKRHYVAIIFLSDLIQLKLSETQTLYIYQNKKCYRINAYKINSSIFLFCKMDYIRFYLLPNKLKLNLHLYCGTLVLE